MTFRSKLNVYSFDLDCHSLSYLFYDQVLFEEAKEYTCIIKSLFIGKKIIGIHMDCYFYFLSFYDFVWSFIALIKRKRHYKVHSGSYS